MSQYLPHAQSYTGQLRQHVGNRKLIIPGARAIIRNAGNQVLLIRRSDNGEWAMPAGSIELGESILDCVKREVKEETGLDVHAAEPIALYTEPRFDFTTAYGGAHQMFTVVFLITDWSGRLLAQTDETVDARFFPLNALPQTHPFYRETLEDLQLYKGRFILK